MSLLFDTSVWVHHLSRGGDARLIEALDSDEAATHPLVIGELAMGHVPDKILRDIQTLPMLNQSQWAEVMAFVHKYKLQGVGLSWVDANLLHSALSTGTQLVTYDKPLRRAYDKLHSM